MQSGHQQTDSLGRELEACKGRYKVKRIFRLDLERGLHAPTNLTLLLIAAKTAIVDLAAMLITLVCKLLATARERVCKRQSRLCPKQNRMRYEAENRSMHQGNKRLARLRLSEI